VHVIAHVSIGVLDLDHIAPAASSARNNHPAAGDGLYRRTRRSGVVCPEVRAIDLQDGMKSSIAEM
jgi:hypothetical protein